LAAQAWWQGREDRSRERKYLRQLVSDTEVNQNRLGDAIHGDYRARGSPGGAQQISKSLFGAWKAPNLPD
jgi:hypothetical protein